MIENQLEKQMENEMTPEKYMIVLCRPSRASEGLGIEECNVKCPIT